jgi:hypothetical protein
VSDTLNGIPDLVPEYMHDETGADGFEWRMVWMLRDMAGNEAIASLKETDFRIRAFHQARERLLDRIASRIERELPELP